MPLELFYGPPEADESGGYMELPELRVSRESRALAVCGRCPVRPECLAEELVRPVNEQWGVRGGLVSEERRQLIREARRGAGQAAS